MRAKQRNRIIVLGMIVLGVGAAAALVLVALNQNINLFYSPTQVAANEAPREHSIRIGGIVASGSIRREPGTLAVRFDVTDGPNSVTVQYEGILPDLFREGQGVVARGRLDADGRFRADEVLAKHDENYMPPEVEDALRKAEALGVVPPPAPH